MKNCGIKLLPEEQKDIAEMLEYIAVTLCAPTAALKLYNVLLTQFQRLKSFPLSGKELEATNVPLTRCQKRNTTALLSPLYYLVF